MCRWHIREGDTIEEALANIGEVIDLEPVKDDWIVAEGIVVQDLVV